MTDTTRIDAILAGLPADQRAALQHLRETIAEVAPNAVEAMSYGAPAFRYRDHPLVSYAALVVKLVRARLAESDERWGRPS